MFVIKGWWRLTLKQEVSGYDITGGDNVVRVRSLMRTVSVRLEDHTKYIFTGWAICSDSWVGLTLMMFHHLAQLLSQFGQFLINPSRTRQMVGNQLKSKSTKPNYQAIWTTLYTMWLTWPDIIFFQRRCSRSSTEEAATKIQAIFRGHSTRKSLKRRTNWHFSILIYSIILNLFHLMMFDQLTFMIYYLWID